MVRWTESSFVVDAVKGHQMRNISRTRFVRRLWVIVTVAAIHLLGPSSFPCEAQEPAFRTGVTVVEMTVVVLDANGTPRVDLGIDDFKLLENDVVQTLDDVRFISTEHMAQRPEPAASAAGARRIWSSHDSRDRPLFVLLLDDLQIGHRYTAAAQRAGRGLLDALRQDALLAVVTTSAWHSALVTFEPPGDRQREQIRRFRGQSLLGMPTGPLTGIGGGGMDIGSMRPMDCRPYCSDPNRAARRMRVLEQVGHILGRAGSRRKVVVWVTESLGFTPVQLEEGQEAQRRALRALQNGDVTVYTVDPRELRADGRSEWFSRAESEAAVPLNEFARATGGRRFDNINSIDVAVARAVRDNLSAYILAYRPTDPDLSGRRTVSVRLPRHPGLRVQARLGYTPIAGDDAGTTPSSTDDPSGTALTSLLESPVSSGNLALSMQAIAIPSPGRAGHVLLTFEGPVDGHADEPVELALVTIDAEGDVSEVAMTQIATSEPRWRVTRVLELPIGPHQIRIAARTADRTRAGVVVAEIDVPRWNRRTLFISDPLVLDLDTGSDVSSSAAILSPAVSPTARAALQVEVSGTNLGTLEVDIAVTPASGPGSIWTAHAELLPGISTHSRRASVTLPAGLLSPGRLHVRVEARAREMRSAAREFVLEVGSQ